MIIFNVVSAIFRFWTLKSPVNYAVPAVFVLSIVALFFLYRNYTLRWPAFAIPAIAAAACEGAIWGLATIFHGKVEHLAIILAAVQAVSLIFIVAAAVFFVARAIIMFVKKTKQ